MSPLALICGSNAVPSLLYTMVRILDRHAEKELLILSIIATSALSITRHDPVKSINI